MQGPSSDSGLLNLLAVVAFFSLFALSVITSTGAAIEARATFSEVGNVKSSRFVVGGMTILSAIFYVTILVLFSQRIFFMATGLSEIPFEARTAIFYALFAMVPVGFGAIAWGFRKQKQLLRMIKGRIAAGDIGMVKETMSVQEVDQTIAS